MAAAPTDTLNFPQQIEDVTAQWVGSVLARRYPGIEVRSLQIVTVKTGAGVKLRVAVKYNDRGTQAGLPDTLIVKGHFNRLPREMDFMFHDEMRAYRDVVP